MGQNKLQNCPLCNKTPKLFILESSKTNESYIVQFKCVKWFGLKTCFEGPVVEGHWKNKYYAVKQATEKWNKKYLAHQKKLLTRQTI